MTEGGPAVEAVVFDVGNVLIEWDRGRLYRRLIPDVHVREHFFAEVPVSTGRFFVWLVISFLHLVLF